MLLGKNFCRCHDRRLYAACDRFDAGDGGDDRLAAADVALDQAHHGVRLGQVRKNFRHDALLRTGQLERQIVNERVHLFAAAAKRGCRIRCSKRTQIAQTQVMRE